MRKSKDTGLLIIAGVLFTSFLLFRGIEDAFNQNFGDFHSYYKSGLALRLGQPIYFDPEEPSFRYSPFFALFMAPFTMIDKSASFLLWIILMIIQLYFILHWSHSLLKKSDSAGSPTAIWLYGASLILIPNFLMANFDKGQANIFLLFWLIWAWVWLERNRPFAAGFCLAVSISTKVTPVLLLPFLLWRRKFKCFISCAVSLLLLLLLPWTIQGTSRGLETLKDWIVWMQQAHDHYFLAAQANQSLFAAIHRLFSKQESAYMVELGFATLKTSVEVVRTVYVLASVLLYSAFLFKPEKSLSNSPYHLSSNFIDFLGMLIAITLIFPVAWKYAFVLLLPPVMVILTYLFRNGGKDIVVLLLLAGFFALSTVIPSLPVYSIRIKAHFYSFITWGTLLLALAFLKMKHRPLHSSFVIPAAPTARCRSTKRPTAARPSGAKAGIHNHRPPLARG